MVSIHIPFMEIAFSGPGPGGPNPTGRCPLQEYRIREHRWKSLGHMSTQRKVMKRRLEIVENQQERAKKQ